MTLEAQQSIVNIQIGNAQIIGDREEQQDSFAIPELAEGLLVIVADGMGGQKSGATASQTVVRGFSEFFSLHYNTYRSDNPIHYNFSKLALLLEHSLLSANDRLAELINAQPELEGMGTTLIATFFIRERVYWVSVGDSPFYRWRDGQLERINANHSLAADQDKRVAMGEITTQAAKNHPDHHIVTSGLMGREIPIIDLPNVGLDLKSGDRFVIASDGVQTLYDGEIEGFTENETTAQSLADTLVSAIRQKHHMHQDNCTVVTIFNDLEQSNVLEDNGTNKIDSTNSNLFSNPKWMIALLLILILITFYFFTSSKDKVAIQEQNQGDTMLVSIDSLETKGNAFLDTLGAPVDTMLVSTDSIKINSNTLSDSIGSSAESN